MAIPRKLDPITRIVPREVIKEFPSDTSPGKVYQVRQGQDGVIYCTCWAWMRSPKDAKDCKHLKRIRESLTSGDAFASFRNTFGT